MQFCIKTSIATKNYNLLQQICDIIFNITILMDQSRPIWYCVYY